LAFGSTRSGDGVLGALPALRLNDHASTGRYGAMSTRRTIGIVAAVVGLAISFGHIILAFFGTVLFSAIPEKYHGHELIVAIGIVLALGGLLLLGNDNQE